MSGRVLTQSRGTTFLWRLFWGWSALCAVGLGGVLLVGGVGYWADPAATTAWKVVPLAAGLMFLAMAFVVVMLLIWQPRASLEAVLKNSQNSLGITLVASRRRELSLLVFASVGVLNAGVGAFFADGTLSKVLLALTVVLLFPTAVIVSTYRRPRFLRLSTEGIESASLRAHTRVTWEGLARHGVAGAVIGSGELVAQLHVPLLAPGFHQLWRNRWQPQFKNREPLGAVVDVEYRLMGVDQNALLELITDLMRMPRLRPYLDSDPQIIAQVLIDPPDPWPDNGAYLTEQ